MGGHESIIGISTKILVVEGATFLILLCVLGRFFFKPITKFLDERSEKIASSLNKIEKQKEEIDQLKNNYTNQIAEFNLDREKLIREAKQKGEEIKDEVLIKAKEEGKKLLEKAGEQIEIEKEKAIRELRKEVADLSVTIATKLIAASIDEKISHKIVNEVIEKLDKGAIL